MTDAIVFKYATESELARLGNCFSVVDCKRVLADIFGGRGLARDSEAEGFLLDLHFHAYAFCREQRFSSAQTSALLGIQHALMERDLSSSSTSTLGDSYTHFEALLLVHSVDRSPKSVMLFSSEQAAAVVDFVTHTYFRHLELYKSVFTPFHHVVLVQKDVNGVQTPRVPRPLAEGVLHTPPAVETAVNTNGDEGTVPGGESLVNTETIGAASDS